MQQDDQEESRVRTNLENRNYSEEEWEEKLNAEEEIDQESVAKTKKVVSRKTSLPAL